MYNTENIRSGKIMDYEITTGERLKNKIGFVLLLEYH